MTRRFEKGKWIDDLDGQIPRSFLKIYFCVYEKENEHGQQTIDVQPIFREGFGGEDTALQLFAQRCVGYICAAANDRPESEKESMRDELRAFLKVAGV